MTIAPIYIKDIVLKDIKTFKSAKLDLERPNGTLPNWTLILGDNSVGKTTLLNCIAWMKPLLPDKNDDIGEKIKASDVEPAINNEENDTLIRLVRVGKTDANLFSTISATYIAHKEISRIPSKKKVAKCTSSVSIKADEDNTLLKDFDKDFKTDSQATFLYNDIVIYAYSASRELGVQNVGRDELDDTLVPFIADNTVLYDAEEILHTVKYGWLDSSGPEKRKYKKFFESIKTMLVGVMPDFENVNDIEINSSKIIDKRISSKQVLISTKHGKKIPFYDFSLGYRSVMSLVLDLAWRMFNRYSSSRAPLKEPAIVIIDELDRHLHPVWQREVMKNISDHFPNVQFIATAHSPLMVQAAIKDNFAILQYGSDGVCIENDPQGIDGWRIDQILTSEFFGLDSARGSEYDEWYKKREDLLAIDDRTTAQESALKEATQKLSSLPTGENPKEIDDRKFVHELIAQVKQKKIKIHL